MKAIVWLIGICALATAAPGPSLQPFEQTLNTWEKRTGIAIDKKAKQTLADQARTAQAMVKANVPTPNSSASENLQVTQQLLRHYCFDVRDKKPQQAKAQITSQDVASWSFLEFIKSFISGRPAQRVGFLEVVADQKGSQIAIDNAQKGVTNRNFVLTIGQYNVQIAGGKTPCTDQIEIRDSITSTYRCGK